ncbi:MAG: ATP-binding protein [Sedimentisphaerales bacterium]|nr:ATP-binding protein [Sedimentisphaerales bacterium]
MSNKKITKKEVSTEIISIPFTYDERVISEHLGSQKYTTVARAIGELVTNAFDAQANSAEITITENELKGIDSVAISDNGNGMTISEIQNRFAKVAVLPDDKSNLHFGKFGVGRFAVYRIGSYSEWTTISKQENGDKVIFKFSLSKDDLNQLTVEKGKATQADTTGTTIIIKNILASEDANLSPERLRNDLISQFCSYLLGNPEKKIIIQRNPLDVNAQIEERETETIQASQIIPEKADMSHLILKKPVDKSRFPAQLLFSLKGRTVAHFQPEMIPSSNYLGIVECSYLEKIVSANRESIIELDGTFSSLKNEVLKRIQIYGEKYRKRKKHTFIEAARKEDYYPYKSPPTTSIQSAKQAVYDVVLETVNEKINLEGMTKKQQAVIFHLLNRSLENENLLEVLQQISLLSDEDIEKFKNVLEKTTIESIIRLSHEVTGRLAFLDLLHELVYGETRKYLKERSQLHKIIETHTWMFDSKYHLATSDKSFRTIIQRHRTKAGLSSLSTEEISQIDGIDDIPDLFLAAQRDYPTDIKHQHLLVELKAPKVDLGREEVEQVRRYAETILESDEFDKQSVHWDIYLVSSRIKKEIEKDRNQKDKKIGVLYDWSNMTVWAFNWSEIITNAKEEMTLVSQHLEKKSQELSVSDYLKENYPEIFESLNNVP